jgi:hypothetical protein
MRFGRGLDNRKLKATDFEYQFTSRETVLRLGEHLRLSPVLSGVTEPYRYEREVEEFLRWSPHVRREDRPGDIDDAGLFDPSPPAVERMAPLAAPAPEPEADEAGLPDPGMLEVEEVIALVAHLDDNGLDRLEVLERSGQSRDEVFEAIAGAREYESR